MWEAISILVIFVLMYDHSGYAMAVVDLNFPAARDEFEDEMDISSQVASQVASHMEGTREGRRSNDADAEDEADELEEEEVPPWLQDLPQQPPINALLTGLPLRSSGFGKIGISRSDGVQKRLKAIQGALAEALRCLALHGLMAPSVCISTFDDCCFVFAVFPKRKWNLWWYM